MKNITVVATAMILIVSPVNSQQTISPISDLIHRHRTAIAPPIPEQLPIASIERPAVKEVRTEPEPVKLPDSHTIQFGDNPWTIARDYGISMKELLAINNIKNTKNLQIGQILKLPARQITPPAKPTVTTTANEEEFDPGDYEVYTIKSGDNPWTVARKLEIDYQALIDLNRISDPRDLKIGQKLKLPKPGEAVPAFATTETAEEATFDADGHDVYTIKKGDNPWTVAQKLKIDYEALVALNNIEDPRDLKIGQKLKLPKPGQEIAMIDRQSPEATEEPTFNARGHEIYTIKRGDNPWTVARRLKIDYQELMDLNSDVNPRDLKIGQKLRLPKQ